MRKLLVVTVAVAALLSTFAVIRPSAANVICYRDNSGTVRCCSSNPRDDNYAYAQC